MKTFFRLVAVAMTCLAGLSACSSDKTEATTGTDPVQQPQIMVRNVSTTGFSLQWNAVEGAGSYIYSFNNGEETTVKGCEVKFEQLARQTEYVVAVKACPADPTRNTESAYTYVHVKTDDLGQLTRPDITLGCAYASKTIISWTAVADAFSYEYEFNGKIEITDKCQIELTKLTKSTAYTFKVRAISSDGTRFGDSEFAVCQFTTETADMPTIIISPTTVTSDSVTFDIYATSDVTYYYAIESASSFMKHTEQEILTTYQTALIEYAKKQGISIPLAMASLLVAGNNTLQITQLVPELSYVIFAFGMNNRGELTTGLYSSRIKTPYDGYTDGPNFGSSNWFKQDYYLSDQGILMGYDRTNSTHLTWKGQDVASIRYQVLTTASYKRLFTDESSVRSFLESDYAKVATADVLTLVNGAGVTNIYGASPGVAYTTLSLIGNSGGEQKLFVNSVTTKTSSKTATWFLVQADIDDRYDTSNTGVAGFVGLEIATCRFCILDYNSVKDIPTSQYPDIVAQMGHDTSAEQLAMINDGGYGFRIVELSPKTTYIVLASATNTASDKKTAWDTFTTTAATSPASASVTRSGGIRIQDGDPLLFPVKTLHSGPTTELDPWQGIHNVQILK